MTDDQLRALGIPHAATLWQGRDHAHGPASGVSRTHVVHLLHRALLHPRRPAIDQESPRPPWRDWCAGC